MEVTKETPIAALTLSQFMEVLDEYTGKAPEAPQKQEPAREYVYGLKGIRELFQVSHSTAQQYKNTFLKPAIRQNGRKIVVDVAKALELFDQNRK